MTPLRSETRPLLKLRAAAPVVLALAVICLILAGQAESAAAQQTPAATEAGAENLRVRVTKKDCRRVVRHQARADVDYKPGVDARGNPVAPADLAGGFTIPLPDVFEFNVTKDLQAYLDGPEEAAAAAKAAAEAAASNTAAADAAAVAAQEEALKSPNMELNVGTVRYDIKTGAMTFNGRPLNDAAMGELAVICREMLEGEKRR